MKTKLFFALALGAIFNTVNAQQDAYGYTTVNATMEKDYAKRVFFNLNENKLTSQPANTWDVAFWRINAMQYGSRINDAQNIKVYQASANPAEWDNVKIANLGTWGEPLYNPDKTDALNNGAFEQTTINKSCNPQFNVGWGCYNLSNHHIEGKVIFVLEYPDGTYVKFMIADYYGGYTIKYAKSNGGEWQPTQTKTIANGDNEQYFNYFSFATDNTVPDMEPPKDKWDLMFTRYWTFYNNIMMYRLSGIIQNPTISVAKVTETQETAAVNKPADSEFKKDITTIGHSWKNVSNLTPDMVYYIKKGDKYYRMYFTQNGGSATGNMFFKYKDISNVLATHEVNAKATFGLFPNPAPNKQVTLLYDVKETSGNTGKIEIYDWSGRKVFETSISKTSGFFKKQLNLQNLQPGIYLVKLSVDSFTDTKKLVLK